VALVGVLVLGDGGICWFGEEERGEAPEKKYGGLFMPKESV